MKLLRWVDLEGCSSGYNEVACTGGGVRRQYGWVRGWGTPSVRLGPGVGYTVSTIGSEGGVCRQYGWVRGWGTPSVRLGPVVGYAVSTVGSGCGVRRQYGWVRGWGTPSVRLGPGWGTPLVRLGPGVGYAVSTVGSGVGVPRQYDWVRGGVRCQYGDRLIGSQRVYGPKGESTQDLKENIFNIRLPIFLARQTKAKALKKTYKDTQTNSASCVYYTKQVHAMETATIPETKLILRRHTPLLASANKADKRISSTLFPCYTSASCH